MNYVDGFRGIARSLITVPPRVPGPIACLSLDLESDYATDSFEALRRLPELRAFCAGLKIPLTIFVEGRVLRDYADCLGCFPQGTDFQLHCGDHRHIPDRAGDLKRSFADFTRVFGRAPIGYRAGNYKMTKEILETLETLQFKWDASYLSSGVRDLQLPSDRPFRMPNGLWELPVTRWPVVGIPMTMSMVSLLGTGLTKALKSLVGVPAYSMFVFHLHDIFPTTALRRATLKRRLGHSWNYRFGLRDPFKRFADFVLALRQHDCRFVTGSEIFQLFRDNL